MIAPEDRAEIRRPHRSGGGSLTVDLRAIVAPVEVHHGEADTMTPIAHSRHTADLVPGARLTTWPGEGHISLITKLPRIASDLVATLR